MLDASGTSLVYPISKNLKCFYNILGKVITVVTVRRCFQVSVVADWYRRRITVMLIGNYCRLLAIAAKVLLVSEREPEESGQDLPEYFAGMLGWRL